MPSTGPYPTIATDETWPGRHHDPRLQMQRHHRPIRGNEPRHRSGPHRSQQGPHRFRRPAVLQTDRRHRAPRPWRARRPGQPVGALHSRDQQMARPPRPAAMAPALHTHIQLLAEPDRTMVQRTHRPTPPPRHLHQCRRTLPTQRKKKKKEKKKKGGKREIGGVCWGGLCASGVVVGLGPVFFGCVCGGCLAGRGFGSFCRCSPVFLSRCGVVGVGFGCVAPFSGCLFCAAGRYRHAARRNGSGPSTTCKMCTEDQSPTTALLVEVPVPTMLVAEQAGARPTRRGWSTIAAVGYARVRLDPADVRTAVKELHALDVDSANIHLDRGMARQRDTPTLQESHRKSPAGRQPGNGEPRPIGAQLGRTDSCGWAARTTAGSAHRGSYLPGGQVR